MPDVIIRKGQAGDEKEFAHVQVQSWISVFSHILPGETMQRMTDEKRIENMYARLLREGDDNLYLLSVDGMGSCIAGWNRDRSGAMARTAELICIHALPDARGKGYGSGMMERILQDIALTGAFDRVVLWVFEKNTRARRFYEKHGFCATECRKDSFGATEMMYMKKLAKV